ncbi:hypothetical protein YH65_01510 [Sulfurovum lithotrophicum]|uniref:DUF2279 domain-containing protein n=1 Tax=Sulfurovum lithotrophicum TaxID=206403 RepID=A0A7U4LZR1_9BACT|nr:DUF2279 domain-containing protein [Sulfurovum lithotrophicum]AKF24218.1 hypothetical protein YH65_01510 [Sulfurovum lithotrophicum]
MFKKTFLLCFLYTFSYSAEWVNNLNSTTAKMNQYTLMTEDPKKGMIIDNLAADIMIALWGFQNWNWGTESFHVTKEDWFEEDSDTGGADKTGHFYMTYLLSRVLGSRMQDRGWSLEESSLYGSLSAMLAMTLLEVGDGTSHYGFSKEDLLADGMGAVTAYLIRSNPGVDKFLDVRLEYLPSSGYLEHIDTATDYSGMKHLIAFKFAGVEELQDTPLGYMEVQLGYYTRGYRAYDIDIAKSQQVYIGIGLDLTRLADMTGINVLKNLFEFYQPGHTYVETNLWER